MTPWWDGRLVAFDIESTDGTGASSHSTSRAPMPIPSPRES